MEKISLDYHSVYVRNWRVSGAIWVLFALCSAVLQLLVLVHPTWIESEEGGYFGLYDYCLSDNCPWKIFQVQSLTWSFQLSAALVMVATICSLLIVTAILLLVLLRDRFVFLLCAWMHMFSFCAMLSACILYPNGWDHPKVRETCDSRKYDLGICRMRWPYFVALELVGVQLTMSIFGFVLACKQPSVFPGISSVYGILNREDSDGGRSNPLALWIMDPSSSDQKHQSKSSRIDNFVNKLAARHTTDWPLQAMSSSGEMGFCIECGDEGFCTDGLCYNCKGSTSGSTQLLFSNTPLTGAKCSICKRLIPNPKTARSCVLCKKFAHLECCPRSLSILEEYKCNSCLQLPVVFDTMLSTQEPASPLVNVPTVEQPLEVFGATPARNDLQQIPEDLYHLPAPVTHQSGEDTQSCDEATGASPATESDSARNSPFYQPPSDDEEEFKPPGQYVPRGRGRGRGSRGKKPGGRGGTSTMIGPGGIDLMKTRSGGMPPTGHYMDKLTQGTRGKRGKGSRGAYGSRGKGTRGRRARGQLACVATSANVLQHLHSAQYSTTREIDEQLIEDLEDKTPIDMEYVRTAVVYAADDEFMEKAPLCLICGSIGKGEERSFVCCANCAQAYHTFCVGLHEKIRDTIVNRGWRCLDCTICEGCGDGKDDSKLLLCDECDTAYHIYCLDPPLQSIPTGAWRCKYCLRCRRCDLRVNDCSELTREGLCRGCYSLRKCPKCTKLYQIGDQIIRCASCTRWFHGTCEGLFSAEDMENAAANKMRCSSCRPTSRGLFTQTFGSHGQMIVVDNVILHKEADEILKSPYMPPQYRPDHGNAFASNRSSSFDFWSNIEEEYQEEVVEVPTSGRGRGRGGSRGRVLRIGVGGFVVRNPKIKTTIEEEESEEKRMKKPRKPRRTFLEDAYPPNIQEGFFGVPGLEGKQLIDVQVEEPILRECTTSGQPLKTEGGMLSAEQTLQLQNNIEEEGVLENIDFHEMDLDGIDFAAFLDDDDDMEVEDGQPMSEDLRDAFDLVRTDGFDPITSQGTDSNNSMDVQSGANTNNGSTQSTSTGFAARPPGELTRSSSQMDMITAERNNAATERWEEDEPLGERATKAAVLYVNINFPHLKEKVPEWTERVKHIQKLWRTLSSESRKQYVEKARENRQLRGKIPRQRKVHATQMASIDSVTSNTGQSLDGSSGSGSGTTVEPLQQIPQTPQLHQPVIPSQQGMQSLPQYHQQMTMSQGNFPGMQKIPEIQPSENVGRVVRPEIMHHYLMMRDRIVAIENQQNYLEDELGKMKKQKRLLAMKSKKLNRDSESSSAQTPGIPPHDSTQFPDLNPGMGSPEREIEMNATIDLNQEEKLQLDQLTNAIPMKQKDIEKTKQEMKIQMQAINEYLSRQGLSREIIESNLQMQQNTGIQRGYPSRPQQHFRSPYLAGGKWVYSQTYSQEERSIYECVDDLLFKVTDMCEAPPQNMLKRLLEHKPLGQIGVSMMGQSGGVPSASGMVPGIGCGPSSLAHFTNESLLEPPKPKKKRTQVKKTGVSSGNNEIDTMIERINCQLRMSEKFSRRALESVQSKGSGHVLEPGLTELPDRLKDQTTSALITQGNRTNPSPIEGEHFGQTNFTFMDDILQVDDSIRKLIKAGPSMAAFAPAANLQALANAIPTPCELEFDELDLLEGASRWDLMKTLVRAIPRRPIDAFLRTSIRQFDGALPPLEQVRNAFFKPENEDEEVEICIDVNEAELLKWAEKYKHTGVDQAGQELFDHLAKILNNGQKLEYAIDTPPLSPVYSNDGNLQPSVEKQEPFAGNFAGAEKCRACSTYMQVPVCTQNFSRLGLSPASDDGVDESASFCSMRCYYSFVATKKLPLSPDQLSEAERHVDEETISRLKQISADSFAKIVQGKVKMEQTAAAPILSDSLRLSSRESRCSIDEGKKEYSQILKASDLPNINDPDGTNRSIVKREAEDKGWAIFSAQVHDTFVRVQQFKKLLATHSNKMGVMNMVFPTDDNRKCKLCDVVGDAETATQGRLLNFDVDQWVHVNCALWSAEVFESPSTGALSHVQKAVERAQQIMCHKCGRLGASMQCHKADCQSSFHLPCAKEIAGSKFLKDRTFICSRHHEVTNEVVLTGLDAVRRLYIDRDENALLGKLFEVETKRMVLKLGSLTLHSIGQLLPEHLKAFHNNDYIYPVGFRASRFFYFPPTPPADFSPVLYRMEYICQILEKDKKPWFDVQLRYVANDNQLVEKSIGSGPTATMAWQLALNLIKNARDSLSQLPQQSKPSIQYLRFFPNALSGEGLFGLKENAITKITESLPGVDTLYTYSFRHGGAPILELPLAENPSGCARTEPRCRTLIKKHRSRPSVSAQTTESTSSSSSTSMSISGRRRTSARYGSTYDQELAAAEFQKMLTASGVGAEWVAAMKFQASEPQTNASIYTAYQKMKKEWQNTVYLARSKIQGLGLYAKADIDMHAMIIEYKGELIRSEICEVREKRYTAQNRGVYMFRIDDEIVIDATMAGGCARYINHSCDPNCSTRIIQAGSSAEDKKIIITANRPIKAHEELTYDYQFELEEETKISCLCGAPNCQKWMN
ncbi:unnamed protein product, partial [Mesorhabditis belari]|uniref:Histone-lysine N-methyltransferase n=1 Tax=Mesorhabditis belari TaxID=2138241 RepID=A0AAF3EB73_9BILA